MRLKKEPVSIFISIVFLNVREESVNGFQITPPEPVRELLLYFFLGTEF